MKQENRFVAQLFHFLAPFVDMERDLFICVDGAAAKRHSGRDGAPLIDPDVPDLWLAFCGQKSHIGIEAKILEKNSISVRQSQLRAWRTNGIGAYKPTFWVASDRTLKEFYCWEHSAIVQKLDATASTVDNVSLSVSAFPPSHRSSSIAELAMFVLSRIEQRPNSNSIRSPSAARK